MCPACMSTLVWIAAGTGSSGGLAALVVKKLRGSKSPKDLERRARARARDPQEKPR